MNRFIASIATAAALLAVAATSHAGSLRDRRVRAFDTAAEITGQTTLSEGTCAYAVDNDTEYCYRESVWNPLPKSYATNVLLRAETDQTQGTIAYAQDTDTAYLYDGTRWLPMDPNSPEFTITFNVGAGKALNTLQPDYTASDRAEISTSLISLTNWAQFHRGITAAYVALADTGQTADLAMVAGGLDISGDDTDNDGYEIWFGAPGTSGAPHIIGGGKSIQFCACIDITDVSDTDETYVGFRRCEPANPVFDNYLDAAVIGISASAATAAIYTEVIDDNAANNSDDTTLTWADGAEKCLCVHLDNSGNITNAVDGVAANPDPDTLDVGDPVCPMVRFLHSAANTTVVTVTGMETRYTSGTIQEISE